VLSSTSNENLKKSPLSCSDPKLKKSSEEIKQNQKEKENQKDNENQNPNGVEKRKSQKEHAKMRINWEERKKKMMERKYVVPQVYIPLKEKPPRRPLTEREKYIQSKIGSLFDEFMKNGDPIIKIETYQPLGHRPSITHEKVEKVLSVPSLPPNLKISPSFHLLSSLENAATPANTPAAGGKDDLLKPPFSSNPNPNPAPENEEMVNGKRKIGQTKSTIVPSDHKPLGRRFSLTERLGSLFKASYD